MKSRKKLASVLVVAVFALSLALPTTAFADSQFMYFDLQGVDKPQVTNNSTLNLKTRNNTAVYLPEENMAHSGKNGFTSGYSILGTRFIRASTGADAADRVTVTRKDHQYRGMLFAHQDILGQTYKLRANIDKNSYPSSFQVWGYFNADAQNV